MPGSEPIIERRSGGCLCGAVRFDAGLLGRSFGACHCPMCRRWTGSALLGLSVPTDDLHWTGSEHIATRQTSSWGMRAWCRTCGSNLFFRVTAPGPYAHLTELPIGLLDDASGLTMTNEIYIDHKPDSFSYAGPTRNVMTRADCVAKFAALDSE